MTDDDLWAAYCRGVQRLGHRPPPPALGDLPRRRVSAVAPVRGHLDLHGLTIAEAHALVREAVALRGHHRTITVVTGRSGDIRREFQYWLDQQPGVRRIEPVNGGGAFRVHFARVRRPG